MTIDDIRDRLNEQPFQPFTICLADGRRFRINHPEFLALAGRRRVIVGSVEGWSRLLDLSLVTSLDVQASPDE